MINKPFDSLRSLRVNQAQPLPKTPEAAFVNSSWNFSNAPNVLTIALASSPVAAPPPCGFINSQNIEWLKWSPPWFRMAVLTASGAFSKPAKKIPYWLVFQFRIICERLVQLGHVSCVVLHIVDLHRLRVDERFESVVCVRQFWQFVHRNNYSKKVALFVQI